MTFAEELMERLNGVTREDFEGANRKAAAAAEWQKAQLSATERQMSQASALDGQLAQARDTRPYAAYLEQIRVPHWWPR